MRLTILSVAAACGSTVSAAAVPVPSQLPKLPPLPISKFPGNPFVRPLTFDEVVQGATLVNTTQQEDEAPTMRLFATTAAAAECANPRIRIEWSSYSSSDKSAFVSAIRCLQNRPQQKNYPGAKTRYDDLVALHQKLTPNIHGNAKFLFWHRYYLWAFEDMLRTECGFNRAFPWFDETKWSGRFSQSDLFSANYFGAIAGVNGGCVPNGAFAGVNVNLGPSTSTNTPHCLQRRGDAALTANTNKDWVNACHNTAVYPQFKDMSACQEGGVHAYGHNGVGGVMADVYASPGDPVFWMHHAFVDRNFRIWQNADPARITAAGVNGVDKSGTPINLDTGVFLEGLRPDTRIRDIINTKSTTLCYRYDY